MKIFGIAGWKNSGKTGLMERLVAHFTSEGLRVSTIKHAHHRFDVDHEGKDSFRHRDAGAHEVILASCNRVAIMQELRDTAEPTLEALINRLTPVDLVLVEGYKTYPHPKIEAHRQETGRALLAPGDPTILALASNVALNIDRPVFDLDDTEAIAAFIRAQVQL